MPVRDKRFERIFEYSYTWETSKFTDHPSDPGGATRHGITLDRLRLHRKDQTLTADDVRKLGKEEAMEIFEQQYWNFIQGPSIRFTGVAIFLLDIAIHHGPRDAGTWVQEILGIEVDGIIGPVTLKHLNMQDPAKMVEWLLNRRVGDFQELIARNPKLKDFEKGWMNRVLYGSEGKRSIADVAFEYAMRGDEIEIKVPAKPKRPHTDKPNPMQTRTGKAVGVAATGVATTATTTAIETFGAKVPEWAYGVGFLGILVALGALGAIWWFRHQDQKDGWF